VATEGSTVDAGLSPSVAAEALQEAQEATRAQERITEPSSEALIYDPEGRGCIPRWS
jgi:hypothetical protein